MRICRGQLISPGIQRYNYRGEPTQDEKVLRLCKRTCTTRFVCSYQNLASPACLTQKVLRGPSEADQYHSQPAGYDESNPTDHSTTGSHPPPVPQKPIIPKLKCKPKIVGLLNDPDLNRDSIAAATARFGDRVLWTSRDTQLMQPNGKVQPLPIISSTASWTDFNADGSPALQAIPPGVDPLKTTVLRAYGRNDTKQAFFPVLKGQGHPPAGGCDDGSRYAIWPDTPPLVTSISPDGHAVAYSWIKKAQITNQLKALVDDPAVSLHRIDYIPSKHGRGQTLPEVTVVEEEFWKSEEIPYGAFGSLVKDGVAYLYGQTSKNTDAVARVPVGFVEDRTKYEYFVSGSWTARRPSIHNHNEAHIPNASAGGQGNYYFNPAWNSFVWIGGTKFPGADFHITTAPRPEGPWIQPFKFYTAPAGNFFLGAYSLQANPVLVKDMQRENAVYLTYTKNDVFDEKEGSVYTTPLIYVEWE